MPLTISLGVIIFSLLIVQNLGATVSETRIVLTPFTGNHNPLCRSDICDIFQHLVHPRINSLLPIMNTPIDPSQQTPLHHIADTLSKWCRKAIVPRRNGREEDEQEEEFSFGIDESMWDKNSMWHLYDDYKSGEHDECEDWDEMAVLDIVVTGEQQKDVELAAQHQNQARSTNSPTVAVDDVFASKGGGEWNDAEVIIDSAEFDEASVYSDGDVSYSGGKLDKMAPAAAAGQQGAWQGLKALEQLSS